MKLRADNLDYRLLVQPNFPLLKRILSAFQSARITGVATLEETPLLKHLRLVFLGTGVFNDTVLYGPSFDRVLLEEAAFVSELRQVAEEFFKQIRQLDEFLEAPAEKARVDDGMRSLPSNTNIRLTQQPSLH